jgi:hypothetical protein
VASSGRLQDRIDALLQPDTEAADVVETTIRTPFSPFIRAHARHAGQIAAHLFQVADDEGLEPAVAAAEEAAATESSRGLLKRAVKTFVTHHPEARARLTLPTVETVETSEVPDGDEPPPPAIPEAALPPGEVDRAALPSRTLPEEERRLDWYREDPYANFHHAHWHDVWDTEGVEEHGGRLITQKRQGELFLYMHQQMLARYDTERRIAGLPKTVSFDPPYTAAIPEGYGAPGYVTRPTGRKLRDVAQGAGPGELDDRSTMVNQAIEAKRLTVPGRDLGRLTENQLGAALEPSELYVGDDTDIDLSQNGGYENVHGFGHVLTSRIVDPQPDDIWWGVMGFVETAIRDPFFYRWHRHIDDQYERVREEAGEADLSEHAARVTFRDGGASDVLLCFSDRVTSDDFDGFGRERLGEDFSDPDGVATDTLTTRFAVSRVTAPIPGSEETYWTTHLTHRPFALFIRVEAVEPQHVTVRVFLAHEDMADDRRMWIELDKFDRQLDQGVNVIGRPDALSSVIKRTGVNAPGSTPPGAEDGWCDCGWPYTLLIPSGASTPAGTRFKLMVALTDWESDHAGEPHSCGSMSYCGARREYPDRREMGYPLHRPFGGDLVESLSAQSSIAIRDVTIRCRNRRPPE